MSLESSLSGANRLAAIRREMAASPPGRLGWGARPAPCQFSFIGTRTKAAFIVKFTPSPIRSSSLDQPRQADHPEKESLLPKGMGWRRSESAHSLRCSPALTLIGRREALPSIPASFTTAGGSHRTADWRSSPRGPRRRSLNPAAARGAGRSTSSGLATTSPGQA